MRKGASRKSPRGGFVMMEVIMALTVFAVVGVSYMSALNEIAEILREMREDAKMGRILQSELMKYATLPEIEEMEESYPLEEKSELEIRVIIQPLEEVVEEQRITTEKGRVMQQMFHVQVIGTWYEDLEEHERTAQTWRYARLYQQ
ncbi:MAG: hypothetical protein CMP27_10060 [Roseibacillus sp.]|nr:hypothetical protein [Roseibacillus sp.]|tara:strand:+ start:427 stop:864 length:438 start_codon:yes stop_codon:yes gene_type:complete